MQLFCLHKKQTHIPCSKLIKFRPSCRFSFQYCYTILDSKFIRKSKLITMEKSEETSTSNSKDDQELPSLIKAIEVAGFDSTPSPASVSRFEAAEIEDAIDHDLFEKQRMHSVSISMPPSPLEDNIQKAKRVLFDDDGNTILGKKAGPSTQKPVFYSQPIPKGPLLHGAITYGNSAPLPPNVPRINKLRDKRFDSFKTWSGKLERQLSNLRGKAREPESDSEPHHHVERGSVPVDRYFDALEGPELDRLRSSEEIILPEDKQWPFLLRFPISSFGIILGVSSQAIMWKTIHSTQSTKFLHISPHINLIFWFTAIALMATVTATYSLKLIFYWEAVRREYYHPIRVNFFFAPWIALLFLAMGVPPSITQTLHKSIWYILMVPIFCLELKIYGQWMSGGQRRLSKVANPSNHLSVVGNFVGALLGATMGIKEGPIFFFAIGMAHYIVLFVTLYQRLPTNETLPKELHPVFFLFVAAPSVASMAWAKIVGSFDNGSKIAYFIAMFLYFSLAIRVNFFRGFRFSLAWWAYTFPMTGAAIATIRYSSAVDNTVTRSVAVVLCVVATLIVAALLVTTVIHALLGSLFPNDIAIAISERRPKSSTTTRRWFHRRGASSDAIVDQYLKYSDDAKDNETRSTDPVCDSGTTSV